MLWLFCTAYCCSCGCMQVLCWQTLDLCVLKLLHAFAQHCSLSECVEHQNLHQHMFQSLKYSARSVCLYASKLSDCNLTETPPVPYHFTLRINDCAVVCPIKPTHSLSRAPDRSNTIMHSLRKRSGVSCGVSGVIGNHDTIAT